MVAMVTDHLKGPPPEMIIPEQFEIKQSVVDPEKLGIWCRQTIALGSTFGPFEGDRIQEAEDDMDPNYVWEIVELETKDFLFYINATDPLRGNWMRYINCARFFEEQNIVSEQEGTDIFYRAIKDIPPGEELLTWYEKSRLRKKRASKRGISAAANDKGGTDKPILSRTNSLESKQSPSAEGDGGEAASVPDSPASIQQNDYSQRGRKRKVTKYWELENQPEEDDDSSEGDGKGDKRRNSEEEEEEEELELEASDEDWQGEGSALAKVTEKVALNQPAQDNSHFYQFELRPYHHIKSRIGRKVFVCDICSGIYRHSFSLKRHYIRNHINYKYVSHTDLINCNIPVNSLVERAEETSKAHNDEGEGVGSEAGKLDNDVDGLSDDDGCPASVLEDENDGVNGSIVKDRSSDEMDNTVDKGKESIRKISEKDEHSKCVDLQTDCHLNGKDSEISVDTGREEMLTAEQQANEQKEHNSAESVPDKSNEEKATRHNSVALDVEPISPSSVKGLCEKQGCLDGNDMEDADGSGSSCQDEHRVGSEMDKDGELTSLSSSVGGEDVGEILPGGVDQTEAMEDPPLELGKLEVEAVEKSESSPKQEREAPENESVLQKQKGGTGQQDNDLPEEKRELREEESELQKETSKEREQDSEIQCETGVQESEIPKKKGGAQEKGSKENCETQGKTIEMQSEAQKEECGKQNESEVKQNSKRSIEVNETGQAEKQMHSCETTEGSDEGGKRDDDIPNNDGTQQGYVSEGQVEVDFGAKTAEALLLRGSGVKTKGTDTVQQTASLDDKCLDQARASDTRNDLTDVTSHDSCSHGDIEEGACGNGGVATRDQRNKTGEEILDDEDTSKISAASVVGDKLVPSGEDGTMHDDKNVPPMMTSEDENPDETGSHRQAQIRKTDKSDHEDERSRRWTGVQDKGELVSLEVEYEGNKNGVKGKCLCPKDNISVESHLFPAMAQDCEDKQCSLEKDLPGGDDGDGDDDDDDEGKNGDKNDKDYSKIKVQEDQSPSISMNTRITNEGKMPDKETECGLLPSTTPELTATATDGPGTNDGTVANGGREEEEDMPRNMKGEHMPGLFRCNLCNDLFNSPKSLKKHIANHPDVPGNSKAFSCDQCSMKFSHRQNLMRHQAVHTGAVCKQYECKHCNRKFNSVNNQKRHERIHQARRCTCDYCGVTFSHAGELRKHIRKIHSKAFHACAFCKRYFPMESMLREHAREEHNETLETNRRELTLQKNAFKVNEKADRVESMRLAMHKQKAGLKFACTICKKKFPDYINMCRHRRLAHNRSAFIMGRCIGGVGINDGANFAESMEYSPIKSFCDYDLDPKSLFYANIAKTIEENLQNYVAGTAEHISNSHAVIRWKDANEEEAGKQKCKTASSSPSNRMNLQQYNFPQGYKLKSAAELYRYVKIPKIELIDIIEPEPRSPNSDAVAEDPAGDEADTAAAAADVDDNDGGEEVEETQGCNGTTVVKEDAGDEQFDEDNESSALKCILQSPSYSHKYLEQTHGSALGRSSSTTTTTITTTAATATATATTTANNSSNSSNTSNTTTAITTTTATATATTTANNSSNIGTSADGAANLGTSISSRTDASDLPQEPRSTAHATLASKCKPADSPDLRLTCASPCATERDTTTDSQAIDLPIRVPELKTCRICHAVFHKHSPYQEHMFRKHKVRVPEPVQARAAPLQEVDGQTDILNLSGGSGKGVAESPLPSPAGSLEQLKSPLASPTGSAVYARLGLQRLTPASQDPSILVLAAHTNHPTASTSLGPCQDQPLDLSKPDPKSTGGDASRWTLPVIKSELPSVGVSPSFDLMNNHENQETAHLSVSIDHRSLTNQGGATQEQWDPPKKYVCGTCEAVFPDSLSVREHQNERHPHIEYNYKELEVDADIKASLCSPPKSIGLFNFSSSQLPSGNKKLKPVNNYTCTRCSKKFSDVYDLHLHIVECGADLARPRMIYVYCMPWIRGHRVRVNKMEKTGAKKTPKKKTSEVHVNPAAIPINMLSGDVLEDSAIAEQKKRDSIDGLEIDEEMSNKKRRRRNFELLYNPHNHIRRREMTEIITDTQKCSGCGENFKTISLLERHIPVCSHKEKIKDLHAQNSAATEELEDEDEYDPNKHLCIYCLKQFTYEGHLRKHVFDICTVRKEFVDKGEYIDEEWENDLVARVGGGPQPLSRQSSFSSLTGIGDGSQDSTDTDMRRRGRKRRRRGFGWANKPKNMGFRQVSKTPEDENAQFCFSFEDLYKVEPEGIVSGDALSVGDENSTGSHLSKHSTENMAPVSIKKEPLDLPMEANSQPNSCIASKSLDGPKSPKKEFPSQFLKLLTGDTTSVTPTPETAANKSPIKKVAKSKVGKQGPNKKLPTKRKVNQPVTKTKKKIPAKLTRIKMVSQGSGKHKLLAKKSATGTKVNVKQKLAKKIMSSKASKKTAPSGASKAGVDLTTSRSASPEKATSPSRKKSIGASPAMPAKPAKKGTPAAVKRMKSPLAKVKSKATKNAKTVTEAVAKAVANVNKVSKGRGERTDSGRGIGKGKTIGGGQKKKVIVKSSGKSKESPSVKKRKPKSVPPKKKLFPSSVSTTTDIEFSSDEEDNITLSELKSVHMEMALPPRDTPLDHIDKTPTVSSISPKKVGSVGKKNTTNMISSTPVKKGKSTAKIAKARTASVASCDQSPKIKNTCTGTGAGTPEKKKNTAGQVPIKGGKATKQKQTTAKADKAADTKTAKNKVPAMTSVVPGESGLALETPKKKGNTKKRKSDVLEPEREASVYDDSGRLLCVFPLDDSVTSGDLKGKKVTKPIKTVKKPRQISLDKKIEKYLDEHLMDDEDEDEDEDSSRPQLTKKRPAKETKGNTTKSNLKKCRKIPTKDVKGKKLVGTNMANKAKKLQATPQKNKSANLEDEHLNIFQAISVGKKSVGTSGKTPAGAAGKALLLGSSGKGKESKKALEQKGTK